MYYALNDFLPGARIERIRLTDSDFCHIPFRQGELETAIGIFKRCLLLVDYVESIELLCSSYDTFNAFVHDKEQLPATLATVRAIVLGKKSDEIRSQLEAFVPISVLVNPQKGPTDGHVLNKILITAVAKLANTGQPRALSVRGGHVVKGERLVSGLYAVRMAWNTVTPRGV